MTESYTNRKSTFLEAVVDSVVTIFLTMTVGFLLMSVGGYILKANGITFSISIGAVDNTAICEVPVKVGGKPK